MKKKVKRSFPLILVLAVLSMASYIYINSVEIPAQPADHSQTVETLDEEVDKTKGEFLLPDVEMIKKILRTSRKLFSTS
jgi:hypothetical protein